MAVKQVELANPNGCLGKAADDEPLFVLRANDELAPSIVEEWAERYKTRKQATGSYGPAQQRKYHEALYLAEAMRKWKNQQPQPQNN